MKIKFWQLRYKIFQKSTLKDFTKTFPAYFSRIYLQHFSNRSYFRIFLANFYIIKTIWKSLWLYVFDTFLTLLQVFLAANLSSCLDFSNESPCFHGKLRIPFFNERCFLQFLAPSKLKFNPTISQWFDNLLLNHIFTFHFRCYVPINKSKYIDHMWNYIKSN